MKLPITASCSRQPFIHSLLHSHRTHPRRKKQGPDKPSGYPSSTTCKHPLQPLLLLPFGLLEQLVPVCGQLDRLAGCKTQEPVAHKDIGIVSQRITADTDQEIIGRTNDGKHPVRIHRFAKDLWDLALRLFDQLADRRGLCKPSSFHPPHDGLCIPCRDSGMFKNTFIKEILTLNPDTAPTRSALILRNLRNFILSFQSRRHQDSSKRPLPSKRNYLASLLGNSYGKGSRIEVSNRAVKLWTTVAQERPSSPGICNWEGIHLSENDHLMMVIGLL